MNKTLGLAIHLGRKRKGMSREVFAMTLGVTIPAVRNWELGIVEPNDANLLKVAYALGLPIADLKEMRR